MKIAAIDIGSNSIHLAVVRAEPGQHLQIIDREKDMARLASKTLRTHKISEETIDRAVTTLRRFKQLAEGNGVDLIIATATSAVRESDNAREFVEAVRQRVGLEVQVLPGVEEARLIALAVSEVTEFNDRRALIIDIGGGSTEFIITGGGDPELLLSAKLGAVRLTEQFITTDPVSDGEYRQLKAHIRAELARIMWEIKRRGYDFVIGTSGTILNLINTVTERKAAKDGADNSDFSPFSQTISTHQMEKLNRKLVSMNMQERRLVSGLDKERADIIVAGGLLLETILVELGAEQITSCDWSLREGVILNYLRRGDAGKGETPEHDVRTGSVLSVAKRYNYDAAHSHHVAQVAAQIFDETSDLHQLGDEERRLLEYAGLLHDIGYYIAHEDYHRHGLYLIKNSEMPGFNNFEIAIIANMVRYITGKMPKTDAGSHSKRRHKDFFALEPAQRSAVRKLTGILRIADALDRSRRQTVKKIRCEQGHTGVTIHAESADECDVELWMADRNADLFRDVFGVAVKFEHKLIA
ncbi:MAG TPA: Ppx/GppA phosphatase family protein [Blastocatellia bacterium]|nr:Ppx/GppA phosphatase family protein [Blastocatellia bacterium]